MKKYITFHFIFDLYLFSIILKLFNLYLKYFFFINICFYLKVSNDNCINNITYVLQYLSILYVKKKVENVLRLFNIFKLVFLKI